MRQGDRRRIVYLALLLAAALGGGIWWWTRIRSAPTPEERAREAAERIKERVRELTR